MIKKFGDVIVFEDKKEIVVPNEVKQGYISKDKIKKMIMKMRKHIPFFYHEAKTDVELDIIVNDWFRYIKNYRESDCYEVYDMFMQSNDKCSLREFLATLKRVSHRNAIDREQNQREIHNKQLGQLSTTKEQAKSHIIRLKQNMS